MKGNLKDEGKPSQKEGKHGGRGMVTNVMSLFYSMATAQPLCKASTPGYGQTWGILVSMLC